MYNRTLDGQRYSTLKQITDKNAGKLAATCLFQLGEVGWFQGQSHRLRGRHVHHLAVQHLRHQREDLRDNLDALVSGKHRGNDKPGAGDPLGPRYIEANSIASRPMDISWRSMPKRGTFFGMCF